MAGMLDTERSRSRRERTFVGSECAVCEEPLEHTLRGERVLQFSCGHVSHEACFYEYIRESDSQYCPTCDAPLGLDTSRGGNVLDLGKLSNMVRSVAQTESPRSSQNTPMPWDRDGAREGPVSPQDNFDRNSRSQSKRDSHDSQRQRIERLGIGQQGHQRNESGNASSNEFVDPQTQHASTGRRHDYDLHAMETSLSNGGGTRHFKNPIPHPSVTVRSEFPTLNRSRQQQSLTCLVTIEVPEGKWRPDADDFANAPPVPPLPAEPSLNTNKSFRKAQRSQEPLAESQEELDEITRELHTRVENWHGLEFEKFGALRLHGTIRVGKDRQAWQELECYLFAEMLICVKEKKTATPSISGESKRPLSRCTLKGSILIKKHLRQVQSNSEEPVLTLNLSVNELPTFHLQFSDRNQLELWKRSLLELNAPPMPPHEYEPDTSGTEDEEYHRRPGATSVSSSYGGRRTATTAPTEYSQLSKGISLRRSYSPHVPVDVVVVIPVSSSMQGLKISLLRDALRFMVTNLGERDRMGLVTFGSSGGGVPLVGMTTKAWSGWNKVFNSIKPVGQKSLRADVVEGANVAMDLLMQRKAANPISTILLISDSTTADAESVDFVIQRAEAAKVAIHSFGLGLTHKPDTMIELSSRTKASYMYVKDWMMLRECLAGCLGSLQSTSHQNVKLKLRLPEGSPARFVKISGALQITKRATGKDAEAALGDLRFGDKRDILVQLAIDPDTSSEEHAPQDHWESLVSGLEALGGSLESDEQRPQSIEEVPLLQADLAFGDILRDGAIMHLPRPSLLAITMLPAVPKPSRSSPHASATPPIPPHPSIVQRRMELLTSDMLSRALTLVARGQHERAHHLLNETRTILKGLGKGGLPPIPQTNGHVNSARNKRHSPAGSQASVVKLGPSGSPIQSDNRRDRDHSPGSDTGSAIVRASGVDPITMTSLDADIEASLEWISHPAVFSRDSRKAVLQAIGVISSQRGYTFRTASEQLWAERIGGIRRLTERSREWREVEGQGVGDEVVVEES
jgi:hypothetical protein